MALEVFVARALALDTHARLLSEIGFDLGAIVVRIRKGEIDLGESELYGEEIPDLLRTCPSFFA
jgi:hypothetical protein